MADGKLCIVSKEMFCEDPVANIDIENQTLRTKNSGKLLAYGSLTGSSTTRLSDKIGGNLPGLHYIRDVANANSLVSSWGKVKKVVVVGGGYIGMEVAVAAVGWGLNTTVIVGIGAKPAVSLFERVGLNSIVGGIEVNGQFRTSEPGKYAIGDVAAFPLEIYDRVTRFEHVDHARRSVQQCVTSLLTGNSDMYDYLPCFYSRVFEYNGSPRKVVAILWGQRMRMWELR